MRVANGKNLREGYWYRIVEIDPNDPEPSMKVGDLVQCAAEKAGCIDPENHEDDGMGTQWFADFGPTEDEPDGMYRTLVNGVVFVGKERPKGEQNGD